MTTRERHPHVLTLAIGILSACAALGLADGQTHRPDLAGLERIGRVRPRSSTEIQDSYWGVQAGSLDERVLQRAAALGVKWTRLQASWPAIERTRGQYAWAETDRAFDAALRHGITPFVTLVGGNGLYTPTIPMEDPKQAEIYGERPAPPTHDADAMAAWLRFVDATVARYRDRIQYWEVWNEPNHRAYWGAPPDAQEYGRLLRETATRVRTLQPGAKVIGGAMAGMSAEFADGFLAAGNARLIDIVSYHQYEGEPEQRMMRMVALRAAIDRHNPAIATWQGECGYPSASSTRDYRGRAPWGLSIQAKWLLRQAFSDVFLSRSQVSNYFILHSTGNRDDRQPRSFLSAPEQVLGYFPVRPDGTTDGARARRVGVNEKSLLDNPTDTPKPGYFAYQNLCAIVDKTYAPVDRHAHFDVLDPGIFHGIGPADDAFPSVPIVATFARANGPSLLAYWLPWHGQEYLPRLARGRLTVEGASFSEPVLIDLISGEVFALRGMTRQGDTTVFTDLPLADYPFVIAERQQISLEAPPVTYYIDARDGDDRGTGTSADRAWRSLDKVNAMTFRAGDRVLFRAGGTWTGTLQPKGSGAEGLPIIVDRYRDGPKPHLRGDGAVAAVLLDNQEYWEINNLEITNDAPSEDLRRGVLVRGGNLGRTLRHVYLRGLDVHHVKGKLGAEMAEKTTGGIGFEIRGTNSPTRFDDILVEGCTVRSVDNTGLYTYSDYMPHPRDPRWEETRFTNVRIRENRLTDIGKNAMAVRASLAPVIEGNVIEGAAARLHGNAIYVFGCKDALIQFNEVSKTRFEAIEGAAFDSDYNSEGTVIQYNYSHDNGGGLVNLCNNPESKPPRGYNDGTIVRYNISQNETDRVIAFDGPVTNTEIYNNTIYIGPGLSPRVVEFDTFGKAPGYASRARFANNIIANLGSGSYAWGDSREVSFDHNCFFGNHPASEPSDAHKVIADPLFVAPGTGGVGVDSAGGYRLQPGSPCRDSGVAISPNGGRDYWGNLLYTDRPDRGAHEAQGRR